MKTVIKRASWKSKGLLVKKKKYMSIVTNVFWQSDDSFIDTDSKFLFKMVCANFFSKYDKKLCLTLTGDIGIVFSDAYRLYVYNLIYTELTGESIKNDILEAEDSETLFYQVMLDAQMPEHQERVLKIIRILEINFKRESDKYMRILFNTKKKKGFKLGEALSFEK